MAEGAENLDKISKLPFANYDIVVYFGIGILSLPFVYRYALGGLSKLPPVFAGYTDPLINSIVSIIALAFAVYILGHGIAIASSIIVERFVHRVMGQPSAVIVEMAQSGPVKRSRFRTFLKKRFVEAYWNDIRPADVIRGLIHAPVIPLYALMYTIRFHGFYESKVSPFIVKRVNQNLHRVYDYDNDIAVDPDWFKIVEYSCANNHATSMAKITII